MVDASRSLASVPRPWRIAGGVVVGVLLGAVAASQTQALLEAVAWLSPRPGDYAETGDRLTFIWGVVYFLVAAQLPVVLAYLVAGRGLTGWAGVLGYVGCWLAVAGSVPTAPNAAQSMVVAVAFLGVGALFGIQLGIDSDSVPHLDGHFGGRG